MRTTNRTTKTDLKQAIIRILDQLANTVGAGFVVTDDGLIATCAHVVEAAGAGPGEVVRIVFHATGEERQAYVEPDWWRGSDAEDVAILRLEEPLPEEVEPFPLGSSGGTSGHSFKTFGFPDVSPEEGIWGDGHILEATTLQGVPVLQLRSQEVTPGCSGAPVLDTVTHRVVGMVTAITEPDAHSRLAETAFITPTETMRAACPALQLSDLCPYRGLAAFTEADAEFFFGRERVVERLVESLGQEPRFLAVLGPSGCGKSSLVQAGLIPHLRRGAVPGSDRWAVMVTRPADQPFHQLDAQGLTGARENLGGAVQAWLRYHPKRERLVLVLDQFEELLVAGPEDLRLAFLAQLTTLLEAALPVTLALVLRDDFYSRFAREATALLLWLERGLVNVSLTLTRDELRDIVEGPARAVGLTFEAGLVEDILKDALGSVAAGEGQVGRSTILPLLEFTLTQLWERRQDGVLTHNAYEAIGGVTGGLTQWADRAYYGLRKEQQRLARRVLTNLVHLGDESQGLPDSRRRRPLGALYWDEREQEAVHRVVRRLADARLLVTGRDLQSKQETVELIHDALLREWRLLQGWLAEDRRFLAWRQALEGRLRAWVESAPNNPARRDPGQLLRGRDLVEAERWLTERRDDLQVEEQAFVQTSAGRAKRVKWLVAAGVALAFLVVSSLALLAGMQWRRAEEQRQVALARQLAAQAQVVLDNTGTGLVRSTLLAVEAMRRLPSLEADQTIRRGLALLPRPVARMAHEQPVGAVAFSPNGQWVVSGSKDGTARVWGATTGEEVARMTHEDMVMAVAFSPDGKWVASGSVDGTARVWEATTGQEIVRVEHEDAVRAVAFSPDGRWLATSEGCPGLEPCSAIAYVWDVATGQEVARMEHEDVVEAVAFSPDGKWVASGSDDNTARVWEAATGREVAQMVHKDWVWAVAFSPDGRWLATGSSDGTARVWEAASGREVAQMTHKELVYTVAFSPDGRWVISGSGHLFPGTGEVRVWEATTGKEVARMKHEDGVNAVAFSPDGKWVASGSGDNTARVWEAATGKEVARMEHENAVEAVAFSPDGRWLATGSGDPFGGSGEMRVWEVVTGVEMARMEHEASVHAVAFSSDGRWLATASRDGTARVWEAATGREVAQMVHKDRVWAVAFSPDGRWLASGESIDGTAWVWDVVNNQEVARMEHQLPVHAMAFSPDGRWVGLGSINLLRVWEATTGQEVARMEHERPVEAVQAVAFSPDRNWVASGNHSFLDGTGEVRVWEVATGQEVARMAHKGSVTAVAFSPNGRWLATAERCSILGTCSATIYVWDVTTGQEVGRMAHEGPVYAMTFSPDGRQIASGSGDRTVRVWKAATGREVARMTHEDSVLAVAFSPDGKWVASGSEDGIVRVWWWRPEDLIEEACAHLPRNLTLQEWEQYLPDEPYRPTCPNLPVLEE